VMNWRSYADAEYEGKAYGHKAHEFEAFTSLPAHDNATRDRRQWRDVPRARLERLGWRLREGRLMTLTFDDYVSYISRRRVSSPFARTASSRCRRAGSVSGALSISRMAGGRHAGHGVLEHLPCGRGLFAVRDVTKRLKPSPASIRIT